MSVAVMLTLAVVTAGGEAWAKNWNLSEEEKAQQRLAGVDDKRLCHLAFDKIVGAWRSSSVSRYEVLEAKRRGLACGVDDNLSSDEHVLSVVRLLGFRNTKHSRSVVKRILLRDDEGVCAVHPRDSYYKAAVHEAKR